MDCKHCGTAVNESWESGKHWHQCPGCGATYQNGACLVPPKDASVDTLRKLGLDRESNAKADPASAELARLRAENEALKVANLAKAAKAAK